MTQCFRLHAQPRREKDAGGKKFDAKCHAAEPERPPGENGDPVRVRPVERSVTTAARVGVSRAKRDLEEQTSQRFKNQTSISGAGRLGEQRGRLDPLAMTVDKDAAKKLDHSLV